MRGKRARDIKRAVLSYMKDNKMDMRLFKNIYRRTKRNYNLGIA